MSGSTVRLDLRAVLPVAALAIVVLIIIFVELCGSEDVKPRAQSGGIGPTATTGPTFTPGPSPTGGAPTETEAALPTGEAPVGGEEERDSQRASDLTDLQVALEQYNEDKGEYPATGGNIQSLCVFEDSDAGCDLRDFIDPIPVDPLENPAVNGYFYASDGQTYVLYATREGDQLEECDEHPDHLKDIDSLYCVRSP